MNRRRKADGSMPVLLCKAKSFKVGVKKTFYKKVFSPSLTRYQPKKDSGNCLFLFYNIDEKKIHYITNNNVAAVVKTGLGSRGISQTLILPIVRRISSILCVHSRPCPATLLQTFGTKQSASDNTGIIFKFSLP